MFWRKKNLRFSHIDALAAMLESRLCYLDEWEWLRHNNANMFDGSNCVLHKPSGVAVESRDDFIGNEVIINQMSIYVNGKAMRILAHVVNVVYERECIDTPVMTAINRIASIDKDELCPNPQT